MSLGETVENTLKGGGAEQRGGDKKILKRGVSWVRGGGALEPPYKTMYPPMEHLSNDHEDCVNQH